MLSAIRPLKHSQVPACSTWATVVALLSKVSPITTIPSGRCVVSFANSASARAASWALFGAKGLPKACRLSSAPRAVVQSCQ